LAGEQADEKAGGCRGADPPAAGAGAETCGGQRTGEGQDLRTVTGLLETGQDSLPLRLECAVIEMGAGKPGVCRECGARERPKQLGFGLPLVRSGCSRR